MTRERADSTILMKKDDKIVFVVSYEVMKTYICLDVYLKKFIKCCTLKIIITREEVFIF